MSPQQKVLLSPFYQVSLSGRKNALPIEERLSTEIVTTENQRSITVIRA